MVTGKTAIPGDPSEQDSYRAELGGLMAMLTTLEVLCAQHTITQGAIELGLDGEGAFKAVFESGPPKVDAKAYDLLRAIKAKIKSLPLLITGRHIKGHQDEVRLKDYSSEGLRYCCLGLVLKRSAYLDSYR